MLYMGNSFKDMTCGKSFWIHSKSQIRGVMGKLLITYACFHRVGLPPRQGIKKSKCCYLLSFSKSGSFEVPPRLTWDLQSLLSFDCWNYIIPHSLTRARSLYPALNLLLCHHYRPSSPSWFLLQLSGIQFCTQLGSQSCYWWRTVRV